MSIKTKFKRREIQLVVWIEIYCRRPENTYRQVLITQYWKHGPDLSWAAA